MCVLYACVCYAPINTVVTKSNRSVTSSLIEVAQPLAVSSEGDVVSTSSASILSPIATGENCTAEVHILYRGTEGSSAR